MYENSQLIAWAAVTFRLLIGWTSKLQPWRWKYSLNTACKWDERPYMAFLRKYGPTYKHCRSNLPNSSNVQDIHYSKRWIIFQLFSYQWQTGIGNLTIHKDISVDDCIQFNLSSVFLMHWAKPSFSIGPVTRKVRCPLSTQTFWINEVVINHFSFYIGRLLCFNRGHRLVPRLIARMKRTLPSPPQVEKIFMAQRWYAMKGILYVTGPRITAWWPLKCFTVKEVKFFWATQSAQFF